MYTNASGLIALAVLRGSSDRERLAAAVLAATMWDISTPAYRSVDLAASDLREGLRINGRDLLGAVEHLKASNFFAISQQSQRRHQGPGRPPLRYRIASEAQAERLDPEWAQNRQPRRHEIALRNAVEKEDREKGAGSLGGFVFESRSPYPYYSGWPTTFGEQLFGVAAVVVRQVGLPMSDAALMVHLVGLSHPAGEAKVFFADLYHDTTLNRMTVSRGLDRLRRHGLVRNSSLRRGSLELRLTVEWEEIAEAVWSLSPTVPLLHRLTFGHRNPEGIFRALSLGVGERRDIARVEGIRAI